MSKQVFITSVLTAILFTSLSSAAVITVGPSAKYDYQTIQDAINASANGDEIIVAPGVYTAANSWDSVLYLYNRNIWIHSSDGPDTTILDGQSTNRVIQMYYGDSTIEGFTIRNGATQTTSGAGMYAYYANYTITNCIFENNITGGDGYRGLYTYGGGAINNQGGDTSINNCVFRGNQASGNGGAIFAQSNNTSTITNCVFEMNTAEKGGGICNTGSSTSVLSGCTLQQNNATFYGGAIYLLENCEITVVASTMENNYSDLGGGGIYNQGGMLTVIDSSLNKNVSLPGNGGGIDILGGGSASVNNSEFSGNSAVSGGGIFVSASSWLEVGLSMFCENDGGDIIGNWANLGGNEFNTSCSTTDGACCTNDICVLIDSEMCMFVGGQFQGLKTICSEELCPTSCPGDLNGDGQVNVNDLMILIAYWGVCP